MDRFLNLNKQRKFSRGVHKHTNELDMRYRFVLLAITLMYPFTPFNFFGGHEIYPWYIIVLIFIFHKYLGIFSYSIMSVLTSIVLYGLVEINFLQRIVVLEFIQLGVVFLSLYYLNKISTLHLLRLDRILIKGLMALVLLMIFQVILPQYFNHVSDFMIFRESAMAVDHRSGGVKGIAPEPAYMAAVIISIYIYSWWINTHVKPSVLLLSIAGIFLAGSLSGILMFSMVLFFSLTERQYFKLNTKLIMKFFLLIITAIIVIYFSSKALDRFLVYIGIIIEHLFNGRIDEILAIGKSYGSHRGTTLGQSLSNFCCGTIFTGDRYLKPYSLIGVLNNLLAPISWLLFAYYLLIKKLTKKRCCSLILMTFYGPVLMILLYVGLLRERTVDGM